MSRPCRHIPESAHPKTRTAEPVLPHERRPQWNVHRGLAGRQYPQVVKTLSIVLLLVGALVCVWVGVVLLVIVGNACSPNEGCDGGFSVGLALPWLVALALAGVAVRGMLRRR
jgi:hypothetical protein